MKLNFPPLVLALLLTGWLLAPFASAQSDNRKARVRINMQGSASGYDFQINAVDDTGNHVLAQDGVSSTISSDLFVSPGAIYSVRIDSATGNHAATGTFELNIQAPPGFTAFVGLSDGAVVSRHSPVLGGSANPINSGKIFYYQIVDKQSLAPAPAGQITRLDVADFVLQFGLGTFANGKSAGRIEVRSDGRPTAGTYGIPSGLYSTSSLRMTAPASAAVQWTNVSTGVDKVETGQVKALRTNGTNTYTLAFYAGDGAGSYSGTAYASYTIDKLTSGFPSNAPSGSPDCMRITETQGSVTIYHYVFRSTSADVWTLIQGTSGEQRIEEHSSGVSGSVRTETILVKNSTPTTITKTRRTWNSSTGYELLSSEEVWSNVAAGSADLTTSYTYHTTGAGSTGKVATITQPDGGVTSFTYYNDAARLGQVATVTQPWGTGTNNKVTTYDYTGPASTSVDEYVLSATTAIGGVTTAKTEHDYYSFASLSSADSTPRPLVRRTTSSYTLGGTTPSAALTTDTISYLKSDGDYVFTDRPYAVKTPDGRQVSFRYEKGTYSGGTFTAGSGDAWRTWIVEGSHAGGSATTSILSLTFESIKLVTNQSTLTEIIRNSDDTILRQKTYVWDGSAFDTTYPIANTTNTWTDSVRQDKSTALNGVEQSWTWNGGLLLTAKDGVGVEQTYAYDSLNRVATVTKSSVSSYDSLPAQYAQTITYAYDAGHRVVTETHTGNSLTRSTIHTYDGAGRRLSTTLPDGQVTSVAYSFISGGSQTVTTLPNAATVTAQSYLDGKTKQVTGATDVDRYFTYTVESDGQITTRVDLATSSSARWSKVKVDCVGRATVSTQPGYTGLSDMVTTNTYDGTTGLLTKIARTGLADELRSYGYMGQLTRAGLDVNANGSLSPSDASDRVIDYDGSGFVKPSATTVWWALSEEKIYPSTSSPTTSLVTGRTYSRLTGWSSNLISETKQEDRFGNNTITTAELDKSKKRVTTSTAYPGVTSPAVSITVNGLATRSTGPDGRSVTLAYDGIGRLSQSEDSRTGITTYTFKTNGSYATDQINTITDPASAVTTYAYNAGGQIISIKNPNTVSNDYTYYTYDTSGRVTRQWGGAAVPVEYVYNSYGQVSEQRTFRGSISTWSQTTGWPSGQTADVTTMTYDGPTGLLTQKLDAASKSTDYTYNQQGQVATRLWSRLNSSSARVSTTYTYASLTGELTRMAYNDGTPQADYTYDRLGLMLSAQDVYNGSSVETRTFEYDSSQRLITEKNPAYLGSRWLTYTYESAGSGTLAGRSSGYTMGASGGSGDLISAYAYDTAGRIGSLKATHDGVAERTFTYGYVSGSSLVSGVSEPTTTGYSQTRAYESNRDLLKEFTTKFSSTTKSRYDYTFNPLGQRVTAKQSGDAYVSLGAPSFYHYTYNSRGEVTAATGYLYANNDINDYSLPMPGRAYAFAYDAAGNRTSATCTTNGSLLDLVTSNNLNQITARENHSNPVSGVLDSNANLLVNGTLVSRQGNYWSADVLLNNSSGFAYATSTLKVGKAGSPDLKQISTISSFIAAASETLTYDHDGNILSDGRWTYAWDAENRLASMQTTSAAITAGLPGKKLEFWYDSTGRRISKKVSNWSTGSGTWGSPTETRFIHQGWNLVAELNASGNRIRTYAWGLDLAGSLTATGGVGALVQLVDHTGTATAYLPGYDGSGNVAAMMKDDGTIAAMYEYGPFGDPLRREGTYQGANPFRHATKYTDNESGYVNYGTRCYDPRNGRFLNRDTIGEAGGLNLYAFVGNNPINRIDVLGRDAFMEIVDGGGAGYWFQGDRPSGFEHDDAIWRGKAAGAAISTSTNSTNDFGGDNGRVGYWEGIDWRDATGGIYGDPFKGTNPLPKRGESTDKGEGSDSEGTDYVLQVKVKVDANGMPSKRTPMSDADYATFQTKFGNAVIQIMDSLWNVIGKGNTFSSEFVNATRAIGAMAYLMANQDKWHVLQSSTGFNSNFSTKHGPAIAWTGANFQLGKESVPGYITLAHELWHTYDRLTLSAPAFTQLKSQSTYGPRWDNDLEYRAITIMENSVRAGTPGSAPRTSHGP